MLGLFIGEPLGIFTISWLSVKLGIASCRAASTSSGSLRSASCVASAFTMSMFIASLAFEHGGLDWQRYSRLGILVGSTLAAVIGFIALRISLPNREANQSGGVMRLGWLVMLAGPAVWANSLAECQQDATSASCRPISMGWWTAPLMLGTNGPGPIR